MKKVNAVQILTRLTHPITIITCIALLSFLFLYIDLPIELQLAEWNFRETSVFLRKITKLADGLILVPVLLIALWFRYIHKNIVWEERAWFLSICIILTGVLSWVLKYFFGRARPSLWFSMHEYGFYWVKIKAVYWSFPSGHATTIFSLAFGLSFLFSRYTVAFCLTALFIALTRVILGYHYLSDVLAAFYITAIEVTFLFYFLQKKRYLPHAWGQDSKNSNRDALVLPLKVTNTPK